MVNQIPLVPAIQWYEGMLLSPQHFQQLEMRWHQVLSHQLSHLTPHHWGIHHLEFDPVTLPAGLLRLLDIHAIMPDGLIVNYSAKPEERQLEIDLTPFRDKISQEGATVWFCVPEYTRGSSPVTGEWPRYESNEGDDIVDENVSDNVIQIPRLLPKISLIISDTPPARYHSFPVAKLSFQDEVYTLNTYMAPCFYVPQTSVLGERCAQLLRRFREKSSFLSEKWQTQIGTPLLGETSAQLRPIVQSIPLLEPIIQSGRAHPYELYKILCTIAGHMSTLRLGQIPPAFPGYNHNDILACTQPMIEWTNVIVDSLERAYSIVLFALKERAFSVMLQPEIFTKRVLIGLKTSSTMSESELADWMRDAIIVSESMLESVRIRRITGAPRAIITDSELNELMPGRGVLIFSVETENGFIHAGERLIIFNPADTPDKTPTEVVLYLKHSELSGDVVDYLEQDE